MHIKATAKKAVRKEKAVTAGAPLTNNICKCETRGTTVSEMQLKIYTYPLNTCLNTMVIRSIKGIKKRMRRMKAECPFCIL